MFRKLIVDSGPENKATVDLLAKLYRIRRVVVLVYHPKVNRIVERGHRPLIDILLKLIGGRVRL